MTKFWNYTTLANAYLKRAPYSPKALEKMCKIMELSPNSKICDVGAGTGLLTLELSKNGFEIIALEPNDAMRINGINYTHEASNITWQKATAENTDQDNNIFDAITYGSSFNVCDKNKTLLEAKRITKNKGWFACMWNHRDLNDPIQNEIENIILKYLPNYSYGDRREDQSEILKKSNLFNSIQIAQETIKYKQSLKDCIEAWHSHATLQRQAKDQFEKILIDIEKALFSLKKDFIFVPYETKIWVAQFK